MNSTIVDARDGLTRFWDNVLFYTPKLVGFLLILVIGYIVARVLGKLIDKALARVGFDRWVEKGGIKQALSGSGYHVSDLLGKIAFYTIFLFVLQLAFGIFGPNPISDLLTRTIAFLPNIFVAILIIVVASAIGAAVKDIVKAALGGLSYGNALSMMAGGAVVLVGVFAALSQLQIAPAIVNGMFYAILAIVVGVAVVGLGGSLIVPMQQRWERTLSKIETEAPRIREEVQSKAATGATML